jgi:hypothetical protein
LRKKKESKAEIERVLLPQKKPVGHSFSLNTITLFIRFVTEAATSLRAAAKNIGIVQSILRAPDWHSGRLWLMRLGYYKLKRAKTISSDWIWIIDHSVQIGEEKCLVILGIQSCNLPAKGECLQHKDVEPIELIPVTQSTGKIVYQQLKEAAKKTGVPRAIIGDKGSDLNCGIKQYCEENPETVSIYDIKHQTAMVLKKQLNNNDNWNEFKEFARTSKNQLQQTSLAYLSAPNQRSKARYMNVDTLIDWGYKILQIVEPLQKKRTLGHEEEKIVEKLGEIIRFKKSLNVWKEIMNVIGITESFIRNEGYTSNTYEKLQTKLDEAGACPKSREAKCVKNELESFVQEQQKFCREGERLPGSSEVIESVFGKQKFLEGEQSKSGFTGLLLGMGAFVSSTSDVLIKTALETVKTTDVIRWSQEHIGSSLQSKRRLAFSQKTIEKRGTKSASTAMTTI